MRRISARVTSTARRNSVPCRGLWRAPRTRGRQRRCLPRRPSGRRGGESSGVSQPLLDASAHDLPRFARAGIALEVSEATFELGLLGGAERKLAGRGGEGDVQELAPGLVVLEAVSDDAQGKRLHAGDGVVLSRAVGKHSGKLDHLGDPAPVGLALKLDSKDDRHRSPPDTSRQGYYPRASRCDAALQSHRTLAASPATAQRLTGGCRCYAAFAITRPTSLRDAPKVSSDLISRSSETEASAASIFATRDWLEPSRRATCDCCLLYTSDA